MFNQDLKAFIFYPSTHIKSHDDAHTPLREITQRHYAKHIQSSHIPVQLELPQKLGGTVFASSYDRPDPLLHEQAASKLFSPTHHEFATAADRATRKYTWLEPNEPHNNFSHIHGIGSYENNVEPSMITVFHKPVSGKQLQNIGANVGAFARQHSILLFSPHPNGFEKLLHMRVRTHEPHDKLDAPTVARISENIHSMFNNYFKMSEDGKVKTYTLPGRSILPDTTGHTDVLTWIGQHENDPVMRESEFYDIAQRLGGGRIQAPQFWQGTGTSLGGTSPYSDSEAEMMGDTWKRFQAKVNYRRILQGDETVARSAYPMEPKRLAAVHSPAKTGAVVRGINYPPGAIIPTPIQMDGKEEQPKTWREKILAANKKRKEPNADNDPSRVGRNRTVTGTTHDDHEYAPSTATDSASPA